MTALPPLQTRAMRETAAFLSVPERWEALHEKAEELTRLAGLASEHRDGANTEFAARFDAAGDWQQKMASQGIDDIVSMLRPGLQALRVVQSRGVDANAAALALWREFYEARAAVLALVEPLEATRAA